MKVFRVAVAIASSLVFLVGLYGCGAQAETSVAVADDGIAAVVNGVEIPESMVDEYILSFRSTSDELSSDSGWQSFLTSHGFDEESYREQVVIEKLIRDELVYQAACKAGVEVDEDYIDQELAVIKAHYSSETLWQAALAASGYTEEQYRTDLEYSYLASKFKSTQIVAPAATANDIQAYCDAYASEYAGKRSSQILFSTADAELAEQVYDSLVQSENLAQDFAAAAAEYSIDTGTKDQGGDMGWDSLLANSDLGSYSDALDTLAVGEISAPVRTNYGYCIIFCTGEFSVPEDGSAVDVSSIPSEIYALLVDDLEANLLNQAFDDYVEELRKTAEVTVYKEDGSVAAGEADVAESDAADTDAAPVDAGVADANAEQAGTVEDAIVEVGAAEVDTASTQ